MLPCSSSSRSGHAAESLLFVIGGNACTGTYVSVLKSVPGRYVPVMTDGRRAATASQRHVAHLQQTNAEERRRRDVTTREGREVVIRGGAKVRSWGRVMK